MKYRTWTLVAFALVGGLLGVHSGSASPIVVKQAKKPSTETARPAKGGHGETKKDTAGSSTATSKDDRKTAAAPDAKDSKDAKDTKKDAAAKPTAEESAKPSLHKVKKGPFRIEVLLDGTFEAQTTHELSIRPQEWISLTVLKAVEHGSTVRRGDLVLALDTEKIDRVIADLQSELRLGDLSLKTAQQQVQAMEASTPLDLAAGERNNRIAAEDSKFFFEVDKPWLLKTLDFSLQMAKDSLDYEQEELRQLEKMYKADDIKEETEEIVLRRARDTVKRAQFMHERIKLAREEVLKFEIPRREEKIKDATQRAAIEWERAKTTLPLTLGRYRLELEKLKVQRTLAEEKLNKLLADRAAMIVKAPCDGIVYYGRSIRGKWSGSMLPDTLRRGAMLMPNDVFMTIVQPRPLAVRATVPESQIHNIRAGQKGTVEPTGLGDLKITGVLHRLAAVPNPGGGFDVQFTVALEGPQTEAIMPGMTCEVRMMPYKKADALTIPPKALMSDELEPQNRFVYVMGKGDKPEKRTVALGKRNERQVEVLSGLAAGEQVLLEKPKEQ